MRCFSDAAVNSVADKENTIVIVSTRVYTLPTGKAPIISGSPKPKDKRLEYGTSILSVDYYGSERTVSLFMW